MFQITIKSLIPELQNCMSNPSATVSVLFDSSAFGTDLYLDACAICFS